MPSTSKTAASKAKTSAKAAKPYDRPAKGKGKAKASKLEDIGAPAQLSQTSRKGKKAWRKNVDVRAEEQALEVQRAEERLTGGQYSKKTDGALFTIDTTGDVEGKLILACSQLTAVRRRQRAKKPLRSLAVLNEKSAMPSLTARAVAAKKKPDVTAKEKARIHKIARRTVDDRTSADVRKTDLSELRDAWSAEDDEEAAALPEDGFGIEGMVKPRVKVPQTIEEQRQQRLAIAAAQLAADLPVAGVSYNPAVEAHTKLIEAAAEEERKRLAAEAREAERLRLLGEVVASRRAVDAELSETHVDGMTVGRGDGVDSDEDEDDEDAEPALVKKPTKRKTQAQRNKAKRAKEAAQAQKDEARRRKLERAIPGAKSLGKTVEARQKAIDEAKRLRKLAKEKRERAGYAGGEKVGKFRVPEQAVPVQLGEDLAESLRQVKPEGNLFKDRFLALQRRALVEPRVPHLPKKRTLKVKEYEKHAYKRFK